MPVGSPPAPVGSFAPAHPAGSATARLADAAAMGLAFAGAAPAGAVPRVEVNAAADTVSATTAAPCHPFRRPVTIGLSAPSTRARPAARPHRKAGERDRAERERGLRLDSA